MYFVQTTIPGYRLRFYRPGARFTITSYDSHLAIVPPKLRSTYDVRLIYKTSNERRKAFLMYDLLAKS